MSASDDKSVVIVLAAGGAADATAVTEMLKRRDVPVVVIEPNEEPCDCILRPPFDHPSEPLRDPNYNYLSLDKRRGRKKGKR